MCLRSAYASLKHISFFSKSIYLLTASQFKYYADCGAILLPLPGEETLCELPHHYNNIALQRRSSGTSSYVFFMTVVIIHLLSRTITLGLLYLIALSFSLLNIFKQSNGFMKAYPIFVLLRIVIEYS